MGGDNVCLDLEVRMFKKWKEGTAAKWEFFLPIIAGIYVGSEVGGGVLGWLAGIAAAFIAAFILYRLLPD